MTFRDARQYHSIRGGGGGGGSTFRDARQYHSIPYKGGWSIKGDLS